MTISITFNGLGTVQNYIKSLPRRMNQDTLHTLREWGKTFVILGKALSPEDKLRKYDPRRRPASEQFKLKWRYQISATDTQALLQIGNIDPRMPLIVFPTKARPLPKGGAAAQIAKGYPMRYFDYGGGMHKSWQIKGGVVSAGTPGNPVHENMVAQFDWPGNMAAFGVLLVRP